MHMSERFSNQPDAARFVPSGVDARTWLGFEERIRERRFRALLESIEVAIEIGDRAAALAAIEEARQLRPDARELSEAVERALYLPSDANVAAAPGYVWSRMFGAVSLLLVGVSLLIGLDWLRMSAPMPLPPPSVSLPPPSVSLPPLGQLNMPQLEVAVAAAEVRPAVERRGRTRARAAARVLPPARASARQEVAEAAPVAVSSRPMGWGKVFRPTARFLTTTLPKFLGVQRFPGPEEQPPERRSST